MIVVKIAELNVNAENNSKYCAKISKMFTALENSGFVIIKEYDCLADVRYSIGFNLDDKEGE